MLLITACGDEAPVVDAGLLAVPEGFDAPVYPDDNLFTTARWSLGRRLFFEPALSRDSTVSCATCHDPARAFTDGRPISVGIEGRTGTRNSPSLGNVAYHPYLLREGGVATLEMQVGVPIQEHAEMDFNIVSAGQRLAADASYRLASQAAYDREPDPFVIGRALATFQRSLLSGNSPYDRWVNHDEPLPASAERGQDLFFSERTACSTCHGGQDFTDYRFANNGLYLDYADRGRARLTNLEEDEALFKVPSLRNTAITAPYMHDGSIPDLASVVVHYQNGGVGHVNQDSLVRPLDLSVDEQADLVAFLEALTDPAFLTHPLFQEP